MTDQTPREDDNLEGAQGEESERSMQSDEQTGAEQTGSGQTGSERAGAQSDQRYTTSGVLHRISRWLRGG